MVCGIATELLCSVCDEVCKRGAQMKCCGIRACRSCAVLKINKIKKCWNEECDQEDVVPSEDLKNDDLLRKAVEHFLKNGKMDPAHEKMLKKTGKKTTIGKDGELKVKKPPVDVVEKFNQPCVYGEKCRRKGCLFLHGKPTLADNKKAGEAREKGNGKPAPKPATLKKSTKAVAKPVDNGMPCKFGALCHHKDTCKYVHPKTNKPCRFGAECSSKSCKFDHSPSSKALDRAISKFKKGIKPVGGDLRFILANKRAMRGGMGGMASMNISLRQMERNGFGENAERRNINLKQMLKMKEELGNMMAIVMGSRRPVSGGSRGGYGSRFVGRYEDNMNGSSFMGWSEDRMDGRGFMGRYEDRMDGRGFMGRSEDRMDGHNWNRGYGGSSGKYHF